MSSSNGNAQRRKRSRWGQPAAPEARVAASELDHRRGQGGGQEAGVSDQDALQALLSSAASRERERDEREKQRQKQNNNNKNNNNNRQYSDNRSKSNGNRFRGDVPPQGSGGERFSGGNYKKQRHADDDQNSYYGPAPSSRNRDRRNSPENSGGTTKEEKEEEDKKPEVLVEKEKANFGLTGALTKDVSTTGVSAAGNETGGNHGRMYKGVLLKFQEPPEARAPVTAWRLYVFKGEEQLSVLHIAKQSAYLLGRDENIADVHLAHASCSSQHAVLQYRALPSPETGRLRCQPYLMDLEATNGSFINGVRIDAARYYQLKKGDVLKFGASTREYVLLTANSTTLQQT